MKPAITKQQFLDKIGPEKRKSFEERFEVDLNSDITIEEILELLEKDIEELTERSKMYEQYFSKNSGNE